MRLGAYDYLTKPFSLGQLDVILDRIHDRLTLESENCHLPKQIAERGAPDVRAPLQGRLDAIDERLARIEAMLADRLGPGPRR